MSDDQPHIDRWPVWDEPLSKVTAPFDIDRARLKLARRFNRLPLAAKRQGDHALGPITQSCRGGRKDNTSNEQA